MNKKAIPFAIFKSVYDIPLSFYKENGIKYVLLDLDNTLVSYKEKKPNPRVHSLIDSLKENGIHIAIASNNTNKRVLDFASDLGINAYCALKKPFSGPLKKVMKKEGIEPKEALLIGDQILTDVYAGNGAGIKVVLTLPLTRLDPPWTKINRFLSKGKVKQLLKDEYKYLWRGKYE